MGAAKRKPPTPAEVAKDRQIADRVARARAAEPTFDARGVYTAKLRELADDTGGDVGALLDEWIERSGIRLYDAGMTVADAERLAFDDVEARTRRQRALAV